MYRMADTPDQLLNEGESVESSDDVVEYDHMASDWFNSCRTSVAATPAVIGSWINLAAAAIAMENSSLRSTASSRDVVRRAFICSITSSEKKCKDMLRMSTNCFQALLYNIKHSKVKQFLRGSIEEQLVAFLLIVGHNLKNRVVSCLLSRSGETISRYFHNILLAVITLEDLYVKPANEDEVQPTIRNSHRFFPFFKVIAL